MPAVEQVELDSFSDSSSVEESDGELHSRRQGDSDSDSSLVEKEDLESSDDSESGNTAQQDGNTEELSEAAQLEQPRESITAPRSQQQDLPQSPGAPPALKNAASPPRDVDDAAPGWVDQLGSIQVILTIFPQRIIQLHGLLQSCHSFAC